MEVLYSNRKMHILTGQINIDQIRGNIEDANARNKSTCEFILDKGNNSITEPRDQVQSYETSDMG